MVAVDLWTRCHYRLKERVQKLVLNDPFAAYTAADTPNAFQWAGHLTKIAPPFPWGISTHLLHGSFGPRESAPNIGVGTYLLGAAETVPPLKVGRLAC